MIEEQITPVHVKRPKSSNKKVIVVAILILVALMAAGGYIAYNKIQDQNAKIERLSDPQEAAKDEAARVKDLVGKLVDLPKDETPTIATVNDASKLKGQAFFAQAQNGDKVLIFTKAKKAYLYRPSTNKLVEVAPVNIGENESGAKPSPQTENN